MGREVVADGKVVLYAGGGLVVALKPAGVPTTGRSLDDPECFQTQMMAHLQRHKLWAVHQLDRGTTGLNLFCIRKPLVADWSARLAQGDKIYLALCHGRLEGDPREVEEPIGRVTLPDGRSVSAVTPDGKPARSTVTPLAATHNEDGVDFSLVSVTIHTGRTHQVRLHMAHLGHPLVGERLHLDPPCQRLPYPALHAVQLTLKDRHERRQRFFARVPKPFMEALAEVVLELPQRFSGASTALTL